MESDNNVLQITLAIHAEHHFEIDALGFDLGINDEHGDFVIHGVHTYPSMLPFEVTAEHHQV